MAHTRDFEALVLPHLDAAYNLARWLVRDEHVADDMVQDACLRAYRYFDALRGDAAKPWLLGIVRNNCYAWLEEQRMSARWVAHGEDDELLAAVPVPPDSRGATPETELWHAYRRQAVDAAIRALEPPYREVIVLRELEDLSYAEIAQVAAIPIGTVMSRLSRARAALRTALADLLGTE
ncbi:MAG: sigma-70 family RNA polymerase sigma factor [Proteobacteria bacterium]|jgi:RNA polymerase sigma-70 factor (ECF subfamily)|nr:sigma-70 family RNA polymerase sigma factor [Pseudomonadota bacterium]